MSIETIGYTEPNAQERIDAFLTQPNTVLVDIRFSARSRWAGKFGKGALEERYKKQYIHVPEFGNVNYRPEDRGKGIELAWPDLGLKRIIPLLRSGHSLMLLCACKDYETCHRKVVYELLHAELSKLHVGARVRIQMGDETGNLGRVYNHLPSRPAPWHVRPDSWAEDVPGIAYKADELDVIL